MLFPTHAPNTHKSLQKAVGTVGKAELPEGELVGHSIGCAGTWCPLLGTTERSLFSQFRAWPWKWGLLHLKLIPQMNQRHRSIREKVHTFQVLSCSTPLKFLTQQRVTSQHCLLCNFLQYKQKYRNAVYEYS